MWSLQYLALICISLVSFKIIRSFYRVAKNIFYYTIESNNVDLRKMGKWAVITGATDGIGKAYAENLAERGINIVLISRNQFKLNLVASVIEHSYKVETKTIKADFTHGEEIYECIQKEIDELDVGILVNSAGMSYPHPEYFLNLPHRENIVNNIIRCNITSVTNMCRIVLPQMIRRRQGVVVNISSGTSQIPTPLLTVYGASKAYIEKFSEDLSLEYSQFGIIFQCLVPGIVATKMPKIKTPSWSIPGPKAYVRSAIRMLGHQTTTTGFFSQYVLIELVKSINCISPDVGKELSMVILKYLRRKALQRKRQS